MSKWILTIKQKLNSHYSADEIVITSDSITPLVHLIDVLSASDIDTYGMRFMLNDLSEEVLKDDLDG